MAAALTGCMTDGNGNSCPWVPGSDGSCPSNSSSSSSGPNIHHYVSPTGVAVADGLRFAMTGYDDEVDGIELTTLRGLQVDPVTPVVRDGAPLGGAILPQLSSIDDRIYFVWRDLRSGNAMGAILGDDGTLDGSTDATFAGDVRLSRVGGRYLVVPVREDTDGLVRGTWILSDGTIAGTVDIARGVRSGNDRISASTDAAGEIGLWAMAYAHGADAARELRVARITADGALLDGDGIVVARTVNGYAPLVGPITVLADGTVWLTYEVHVSGGFDNHVVRITRDGAITDTVSTALPWLNQAIARGDRVLGVSDKQLNILDGSGQVLAGPIQLDIESAFTTPAGFAVLEESKDVSVVQLDDQGTVGAAAPLAAEYEVGGGCNASGSGAPWLGLAGLALVCRRRRGQRARRSSQ